MRRGDVVLVDWPYTDQQGSKLRPAIVVQADSLNSLLDDTILVQVTGTGHSIPGAEVEIDLAQEPTSGLVKISYASCFNILTVEQATIDQTLGYLSNALMSQLEKCLKTVLEIP